MKGNSKKHRVSFPGRFLPRNKKMLVFVSIKHVSVTFFSESPLNTDTPIIWTLWHVPLVSVLTGFHCISLVAVLLLMLSLLGVGGVDQIFQPTSPLSYSHMGILLRLVPGFLKFCDTIYFGLHWSV